MAAALLLLPAVAGARPIQIKMKNFASDRRYAVTVTKPGTYKYTCSNHPFMRAEVIVTK